MNQHQWMEADVVAEDQENVNLVELDEEVLQDVAELTVVKSM